MTPLSALRLASTKIEWPASRMTIPLCIPSCLLLCSASPRRRPAPLRGVFKAFVRSVGDSATADGRLQKPDAIKRLPSSIMARELKAPPPPPHSLPCHLASGHRDFLRRSRPDSEAEHDAGRSALKLSGAFNAVVVFRSYGGAARTEIVLPSARQRGRVYADK